MNTCNMLYVEDAQGVTSFVTSTSWDCLCFCSDRAAGLPVVHAVLERAVSAAGDHLPVLRLLWDEPVWPSELHQNVQRTRLRLKADQQTPGWQEHGCTGWQNWVGFFIESRLGLVWWCWPILCNFMKCKHLKQKATTWSDFICLLHNYFYLESPRQ